MFIIYSKEFFAGITGILYPNPATKNITYRINELDAKVSEMTIEMIDGLNRKCMESKARNSNTMSLSVEHLKPGMYFYLVRIEGVVIDRGKLIIGR